ncbi:DUF1837 domain-containing protein [Rufibacter glacialis]|uniref:DUF1837 domain-containing protein n=1 Tax=Rufibacter glacialis TaxID=1259555 RepID=A0A5M8QKI2_9BACT|nr:DUF1837 domain-containing protein [Rufibacter glacialis]KAA6435500.1 DUF1837 domain-containing protein [Rufibacter glacialis]GGK64065.1 hypothetical protein GCM10011405_10040 [Rufibacter glacialis]
MKFEIIVNDIFDNIKLDDSLSPTSNKSVLGIINDFENGKWRYEKFQNFVWDNITETALSHGERKALLSDGAGSILAESAKKLRLVESVDAIGRGSEIAEIVLYGIMKNHYSALPIVPKIFYKQNTGDEAKGSDSVHIVIESEDSFSLWFGESKFYNNIENTRLDTIVASVKDSISLEKIKKENSIITNLSDINDYDQISDDLRIKIKASLSQGISIDKVKPILNIPILLLYECEQTKSGTDLTSEYKQSIIDYHQDRATQYFKKQIQKCTDVHLYDKINFHIILFPIADKNKIVDKFIQIAKAYRD